MNSGSTEAATRRRVRMKKRREFIMAGLESDESVVTRFEDPCFKKTLLSREGSG
jgi:hypothetical protein